MYTNELLEEIWAIKNQLWEEAGGDIHVFCQQLQEFSKTMPRTGPVLRTQEEIERYVQFGELPVASVRENEAEYPKKNSE